MHAAHAVTQKVKCGPQLEEVAQSVESKGQYSYKEVSEVSDVTEESIPEGVIHGTARDLEIYDRLK